MTLTQHRLDLLVEDWGGGPKHFVTPFQSNGHGRGSWDKGGAGVADSYELPLGLHLPQVSRIAAHGNGSDKWVLARVTPDHRSPKIRVVKPDASQCAIGQGESPGQWFINLALMLASSSAPAATGLRSFPAWLNQQFRAVDHVVVLVDRRQPVVPLLAKLGLQDAKGRNTVWLERCRHFALWRPKLDRPSPGNKAGPQWSMGDSCDGVFMGAAVEQFCP